MSLKALVLEKRISISNTDSLLLQGIFCVFGFFLFARGFTELFLPKAVSMLLQCFGVFGMMTFWYLLDPRYSCTSTHRSYLMVLLPFVFLVCASSLLTELCGFPYWFIYAGFSLTLVWMGFISARISSGSLPIIPFHRLLLLWGWILFLVGFGEQVRYFSMPGSCLSFIPIRAASLTGSFLHYPILMALITGVCAQWYLLSRQRLYLLSVLAFSLAPLLTFSRSGVFIVGLAFILAVTRRILKGDQKGILIAIALLLFTIGTFSWAMKSGKSPVATMVMRVFTATDKRAAGNEGRIRSWTYGLGLWADSNLMIGQHTGEITNSTKAFFKDPSITVVESGVIQQLVNFGLLGMASFYSILFLLFFRISKAHTALRYIFLAGVVESLFYQSIEVVPYISLLLLFPSISQAFDRLIKPL